MEGLTSGARAGGKGQGARGTGQGDGEGLALCLSRGSAARLRVPSGLLGSHPVRLCGRQACPNPQGPSALLPWDHAEPEPEPEPHSAGLGTWEHGRGRWPVPRLPPSLSPV